MTAVRAVAKETRPLIEPKETNCIHNNDNDSIMETPLMRLQRRIWSLVSMTA